VNKSFFQRVFILNFVLKYDNLFEMRHRTNTNIHLRLIVLISELHTESSRHALFHLKESRQGINKTCSGEGRHKKKFRGIGHPDLQIRSFIKRISNRDLRSQQPFFELSNLLRSQSTHKLAAYFLSVLRKAFFRIADVLSSPSLPERSITSTSQANVITL
jgi:hypothetical protein